MTKKNEIICLSVILLTAICFRLYKLTSSPPAFYTDESSIAYNAWSIVETGRDEHGASWPMFFEAYGEWKLPVYIYSVALIQWLLGPLDMSVRLPAVIFGVGTVHAMFLWARELLKRTTVHKEVAKIVPFIASLLLAISPWHFQFSRPGFEASSALFFLVCGLWLFYLALNTKKGAYLVLSMIFAVMTVYAYSSARIVTPLVMGVLLLFYIRKFTFRVWIIAALIGFIIALPFIRFSISDQGQVRAKQVSIVYKEEYKHKLPEVFFNNYLVNLSPVYWFNSGDPTIAHMTPHRMSLLYMVELPFFFVGLVYILKKKSRELSLAVILILIGLIPPALAAGNPHALRGLLALPGILLVSAIGAGAVSGYSKDQKVSRLFLVGYLILLAVSALRFLNIYHHKYIYTAVRDWQWDLRLMSEEVLARKQLYHLIYFQEDIHQEAALWDLRIPPQVYLAADNKNVLGNYIFRTKIEEVPVSEDPILWVTRDDKEYDGRLLKTIRLPDGQMGHRLWEL